MHAQSLFSGRREMTILTPGQISVGQIAHYVVAIFEIIMNRYILGICDIINAGCI